jgi:hypothetical protein
MITEADRLEIAPGVHVVAAHPSLWFAAVEAVATVPAAAFAEAILRSEPPASVGYATTRTACLASLSVSLDPPARFDVDLSMREPLEVQVWPDGEITLEVEFTGLDVQYVPDGDVVPREVLTDWAHAWGVRLLAVHNDRARSLPDVWNARFTIPDRMAPLGELIAFAHRAIRVVEAHGYHSNAVGRLLAVLRSGDAYALIGVERSEILQVRETLPPDGEGSQFAIAADVAAFANATHGGLLVFGVTERRLGDTERIGRVRPIELHGGVERVRAMIEEALYPPPEGLEIDAVPVAPATVAGRGLIVVAVPPQDRSLKPFLVHGACVGGRIRTRFVSVVERRGATIYTRSIAALHAELAAGRAILHGRGRG